MTEHSSLAHRTNQHLDPDKSRVIAKLYLPGEEIQGNQSRVAIVVQRVLALSEADVEAMAESTMRDFGTRHRDLNGLLLENGRRVASHISDVSELSEARTTVMGAAFTAEYAIEGAALCNPSVVPHPDQSGLQPGQLRVALSLRAIGEGHVSSVGFASAIVGPDLTWKFQARQTPTVVGAVIPLSWTNDQFRTLLEIDGVLDDLAHSVLGALPDVFTPEDLRDAISGSHADLLSRPTANDTIRSLQRAVTLAYQTTFPADVELSQQVLLPVIVDESAGVEDARFVRFIGADDESEYRATYTAFDGNNVSIRLIVSPDLRTFNSFPLSGPAARNKGMALFPRQVNGQFVALCRTDGETTSVTTSRDGLTWGDPFPIHEPAAAWELVQVGNCGSPIELDQGWLVLTHGVGPMRSYAIGALLLDRAEPTKVIARLDAPLIAPNDDERDGYVPNVLYSCGSLVHDGTLWLPYGIGDARIAVASVSVDELLRAMTPVSG